MSYVNLSGTWHSWSGYINVAGTWHAFVPYVNIGGTWHLAGAAPYTFSITAGTVTAGSYTALGYSNGAGGSFAYGSISGGTLPSGDTVIAIYNLDNAGAFSSILVISGFSSDPGQSFFTSVSSGSLTLLSSAAMYGYSAGTGEATWTWNGAANLFPFTNGSVSSVTIT